MDTDKIIGAAEKWGGAIVEAIGKHGPDAVALAETIARLDAARYLLAGAFQVVLFATALILVRWAVKRAKWDGDYIDGHAFTTIVAVIASIGSFFALMVDGFWRLFNLLAWAGTVEPKIWIAAKLLKLI